MVFRGTIVQQTTPDEFRGRVTAADYVVGVSGGQLGNLEAGALGSLTSPTISALSGGLITVAGAVVIGLALPAFARYQRQPAAGVVHRDQQQRQRPAGQRPDLAEDAKRLVADYSTGMRKKAMLGCALIHNPSVLFLDEPLEGVDPVSADVIRRLLTRFVGSGSTVLFSSHVMELVEQVCDHVSIIDKGRIVATGTTDEVRNGKTLQQAFIDLVGSRANDEEVLSWLGSSSS